MKTFSFRPALDVRGRKFMGLRGFSGKPLHPPLTDVTIGAYVIGPVLDIVGVLFEGSSWAPEVYQAGGYTLLVGLVVGLATATTGFADWLATKPGTQIRRMVNAHAWTMVVTTVLVLVDVVVRFFGESGDPSLLVALIGAVVILLSVAGGTLGGSLVYDFGFNVQISSDNPAYHEHEQDIVHPHDMPADPGPKTAA